LESLDVLSLVIAVLLSKTRMRSYRRPTSRPTTSPSSNVTSSFSSSSLFSELELKYVTTPNKGDRHTAAQLHPPQATMARRHWRQGRHRWRDLHCSRHLHPLDCWQQRRCPLLPLLPRRRCLHCHCHCWRCSKRQWHQHHHCRRHLCFLCTHRCHHPIATTAAQPLLPLSLLIDCCLVEVLE
jgi:hypothetical protein